MKEKEYFSEHGNWFSSLELDASWARSPWRSAKTLRKSKIKMPCDDKCPSVFLTVHGKKYLFFNGWRLHWYIGLIDTLLGGVYMKPGATFAPAQVHSGSQSHDSIFVYMIPPQNVMPAWVTQAWVYPGCCTGARISLQYEISQQDHVNVNRPPVSVSNRSAGRLERVAHSYYVFAILNHRCILSPCSVPSNN